MSQTPLPPADTNRWVKSRKMAVVKAIQGGRITRAWACERYGLSEEELESWFEKVKHYGPDALRATYVGQYRTESITS